MLTVERSDFDAALTKLMGVYNRSIEKEQSDIWWAALKDYEFPRVRIAMLDYTKERQHAPTPASIRAIVKESKQVGEFVAPKVTRWTAADLMNACNFWAIDWAANERSAAFTGSVVERVARAYDAGLAEVAERIVGKKKTDQTPVEAAKAFLATFREGWAMAVNDAVPM